MPLSLRESLLDLHTQYTIRIPLAIAAGDMKWADQLRLGLADVQRRMKRINLAEPTAEQSEQIRAIIPGLAESAKAKSPIRCPTCGGA